MSNIELCRAIVADRERAVEEALRLRRLLDGVQPKRSERASSGPRTSRRGSPTSSSDTAFGRAF